MSPLGARYKVVSHCAPLVKVIPRCLKKLSVCAKFCTFLIFRGLKRNFTYTVLKLLNKTFLMK